MLKTEKSLSARLVPIAFLVVLAAAGCEPERAGSTLGINVRGSVSVVPTTFSGHYIYEDNDGNEVRRNLDGSGNFSEVVEGRRVLLVTLRRTSPTGVIGLVITSDGSIVYDSGILQTNDLIFYEAP